MNCKQCNAQNPNDAVYCMHCGKRTDGKAQCPHCNKLLPAEAEFCIYCGNALAPSRAERGAAQSGPKKSAAAILQNCSHGLAIAMAAFSLVFVFLIGTLITAGGAMQATDLYYYFGGAYADIGELLAPLESYSATFESSLYLSVIPYTIVAAAAIAGTAVFAVLGIVQEILALTKKKAIRFRFAPLAFLTFLGGAVAFLACAAVSAHTSSVVANVGFNTATTAGIALGAVSFVLYLGCRVAINAETLLKEHAAHSALAAVAAVLAVIVLGVASAPLLSLASENGMAVSSPLDLLSTLSLLLQDAQSSAAVLNADAVIALLFVTAFLLLSVIALAVVCLWKTLCPLWSDKPQNGLVWGIALASCATVLLVFSIVSASEYKIALGYLGATQEVGFGFAVPAVLFVFSLLLLGIHIARRYLPNRKAAAQNCGCQGEEGENSEAQSAAAESERQTRPENENAASENGAESA